MGDSEGPKWKPFTGGADGSEEWWAAYKGLRPCPLRAAANSIARQLPRANANAIRTLPSQRFAAAGATRRPRLSWRRYV